MKAITYTERGPPSIFQQIDIEIPVPKNDEVLVKIRAASVNSWDWELMIYEPSRVRLGKRSDKRYRILGADVAGVVEAVGNKVERFKPGDEVFGDLCSSGWGGFAEYTCAKEKALLSKPKSMSFEEAAATPQAGLLALQSFNKFGILKSGQKVLINGAGGGAGTFGIQIAKHFGAEVTAVDAQEKFPLMRALGADHVIDYKEEDFTKNGLQYDMILDVKASHSLSEYRTVLRPKGKCLLIGGEIPKLMKALFFGSFSSKKINLVVYRSNKDLGKLADLIVAGKVKPIIDKQYPLSEVGQAIQYLGDGHVKGKIVITVG